MGKTTLAKKIAYDWAVNYASSNAQQFRLVLAVPLRYALGSGLIYRLAIDYFLSIDEGQLVKSISKADLIEDIDQLKSQLLVILDGLDEYRSFGESPFKHMFAAPFQHSTNGSDVPSPMITFKLIITSRPYACERIKDDFPLLRFVILPLDDNHLSDFVRLYCQTSNGAAKVTRYLKTNAALVAQVPLILTFVCYLADSVREIPTNMTTLYRGLVKQMLMREKRQGKLTETVDFHKWEESGVVKSTSQLGFVGCCGRKAFFGTKPMLEFSNEYIEKCDVTNDSFICGFLLHKFVFVKDTLMAEFPHRSIQEFFAALYCYQLILTGCKSDRSGVAKLICTEDNQIGRFFFGICSAEGRFNQLTTWLNPSLHYYGGDTFNPRLATIVFNANLIDCSPREHRIVGQILFQSVGKLEAKMLTCRSRDMFMRQVAYDFRIAEKDLRLSDDLKEALNFGVLPVQSDTVSDEFNWFLADNLKSARLVVVFNRLSDLLCTKFEQIDCLIWTAWQFNSTWISEVKCLPSVKTLIVNSRIINFNPKVVIFGVNYGGSVGLQLTKFRFDYDDGDRDMLFDSVVNQAFANITVDERFEERKESTVRVKVTVNEDICQSTLIFSLIRLSLLPSDGNSILDVVDVELL